MYVIKQIPEDFVVNEISNVKVSDDGDYSYYKLKKRDYTTVKAVELISKKVRVSVKGIGFAGSKDRRAVTEQMISIKNCNSKEVVLDGIKAEFVGKGNDPISLGDLEGNGFEIVVREIKEKPRKIDKFVNYFGDQRFSKNNVEIGKLIVKKKFRDAVELLIESEDNEEYNEYLAKNPNDSIGLLRKVPKKILTMYVHAFQSYVWNESVKKLEGKVDKIPIVGFGTEFESDKVERVVEEILEKEDVSLRDFIIREIPELSSDGTERDVYVEIQNLDISELEDDELNKGKKKVKLKFKLSKGCYATEVIKALFKSN